MVIKNFICGVYNNFKRNYRVLKEYTNIILFVGGSFGLDGSYNYRLCKKGFRIKFICFILINFVWRVFFFFRVDLGDFGKILLKDRLLSMF